MSISSEQLFSQYHAAHEEAMKLQESMSTAREHILIAEKKLGDHFTPVDAEDGEVFTVRFEAPDLDAYWVEITVKRVSPESTKEYKFQKRSARK